MSEPVTSIAISKWVALAIWAIIGGVTHSLAEHRKGRVRSILDGLILSLISGFAGLMWGLLAVHFFNNDIVYIAFFSGLGGFMSLEGLALMATYIKRKILTK